MKNQQSRTPVLALASTLILVVLIGCAGEQPLDDSRAMEGRDVFGRTTQRQEPAWNGPQTASVRVPKGAGPDAWTIIIAAAHSDSQEQAQHLLEQVQTVGQLPDAFIMTRNGKQVIAVGGFDRPTDSLAQVELERVRSIQVEGEYPYAHAFLAPPSGDLFRGSIPEYDLRNAKAQYGSDSQYTLQIAVYGPEQDTQLSPGEKRIYQEAAEEAATKLRQSGELAFYYHGPTRSMVTVGVFTEADHHLENGIAVESARLVALRERHPLNLLNGRTIVEKMRSTNGGFIERNQKSFLVSIP